MTENQISEQAQSMFLQNKTRREVITFLASKGIIDDKAESMATEAYKAIRAQREELVGQYNEVKSDEPRGGTGAILIGILLMVGGVIATMASDRIWYGLIGVGFFSLCKGLGAKLA